MAIVFNSCDWSKYFNTKKHPFKVECKCILLRKRSSCRFTHSLCKNENIPMWGKHRYRITIPGSLLKAFEKMNNKLKVRGQILHTLSVTTEWNGLCNSVSLLCDMWSLYVKCQWLRSNRELTRIFKKVKNVGKTIKGCNSLASFLVLTIPRSVVRYKNGSNLNLLFERTSADKFNQK